MKHSKNLTSAYIDTQLGQMIVIADEKVLYLLEFIDRQNIEHEIEMLKKKTQSTIISGHTQPIDSIESELSNYFAGKLKEFTTPLFLLGSPFQNRVWHHLKQIPSGQTRSYSDIATAIDNPSAFRAVARAISTNQLAIIIPCHRVINKNSKLGGYSAGLTRKEWLINHEK